MRPPDSPSDRGILVPPRDGAFPPVERRMEKNGMPDFGREAEARYFRCGAPARNEPGGN